MNPARDEDEVMADMRRFLTVLALLAFAGCIVGPQEDLYDTPTGEGNQRSDDAGAGAEADGDADDDDNGLPPGDEAAYPDDGADFGADTDGLDGDDDPAASVEDLGDVTVPGIPVIPLPGLPAPRPHDPDLDASDFPPDPADLGTVDGPGDEGRS
jgi:hypothetical protein